MTLTTNQNTLYNANIINNFISSLLTTAQQERDVAIILLLNSVGGCQNIRIICQHSDMPTCSMLCFILKAAETAETMDL